MAFITDGLKFFFQYPFLPIIKNIEQFKSISGGLLLLLGCNIHICRSTRYLFYEYILNQEMSFYLCFLIWSWYIGAIIGNCTAGYVVAKLRKRNIYYVGGILLMVSGILFSLSRVDTSKTCLLISRIVGGFVQGLTYVVIIVHASENASIKFCVGAAIKFSISLPTIIIFIFDPSFGELWFNATGLYVIGIIAIIVVSKNATETIPFILQNDGNEMDALQTMSKLKKEPVDACSVQQDFQILKNLVRDEMDHYGKPTFRKILLPENRKSLIFCIYGRVYSVLLTNLPLIVIFLLFFNNSLESRDIECGGIVPNSTVASDLPTQLSFTESPYTESNRTVIKADAVNVRYRLQSREKSEEGKVLKDEQKKIDGIENSERNDFKINWTKSKNDEMNERKIDENNKNDEGNVKNNGTKHETKTEKELKAKETDGKTKKVSTTKENEISSICNDKVSSPSYLSLFSKRCAFAIYMLILFLHLINMISYTNSCQDLYYYTVCIWSAAFPIASLANSFHFFPSVSYNCLLLYIYWSTTIDILGNCMLAEAREQYQHIDLMLFNKPKIVNQQQPGLQDIQLSV